MSSAVNSKTNKKLSVRCDGKRGISWAKNGSIYMREYRVRITKASVFRRRGGEDNPKRGVNATWKRCKLENSAVDGTLSFVWPLLASTTEESVEFYRGRGGERITYLLCGNLNNRSTKSLRFRVNQFRKVSYVTTTVLLFYHCTIHCVGGSA